MLLAIHPSSATPIYRQIVEQVRRAIASGQLRPGDELDSVRAVALAHAINPMTVSKAWSLLEAEGLVERRRGGRMLVAQSSASEPLRERLRMLEPHLAAAARVARELGIPLERAVEEFRRRMESERKGSGNG